MSVENSRPDEREQHLDAIIAAYYRAVEAGECIDQKDFIAKYPEVQRELSEFFGDLGILGTALPNGASLAATYISSISIGVHETGRYRLDRVLGEGAFGIVYLGYDEELQRQVAIKVPTKDRFQKLEDAELYLAEARTVASLDDPHIVPVYDVGRTQDGSVYVVSKYIEGGTLADRIKANPLTHRESAQLLATVARALQHAHDRRLIHRDIKPANILLDAKSLAPWVADFGLAIREDDYLKQTVIAGTPSYMSPEQARGEGHRLDGRSDIFSMGVIFYELLTGKKAFRGSSPQETVHQVISLELQSPRQIRDTIPEELERICLKALSKLTSSRYATAAEFADDLEQWLKPTGSAVPATSQVQVVPKGLRSFDAGDAEFFLDLLPGPRNRDGLPESIAFWKQRIEETDSEQTFNVGLLYGPSGCGKSSLVKAGLLPHLSDRVIAVYVEATPEDTETRILRGLRKRVPELSSHLGLANTMAVLRRSQGRKVVIIIDQFEQWLHAHRSEPDAELVKALRQCDGGRLQAIVMLRDDFSMAASRFMRSLDTRIVEGHNFATVDLFEVSHAAKVLTKFGQSFEKLPASNNDLSAVERQFVNDVAQGLAQDGKVVSVRLSMFADLIRKKDWTAKTMKQVGGTEGIGINFLEETFSSLQANPDHRLHAFAARRVLHALLPALGTDIRGHLRSHQELLEASGYQDQPSSFAELLRILDTELRLITPTDPEGETLPGEQLGVSPPYSATSSGSLPPAPRYYQLTHDYLIPSLREWLTHKRKETRKGRAELKLEERSAIWNAQQENKQLPTFTEWLGIRVLTDKKCWTDAQRNMMRNAGRVHLTQWGGSIVFLLVVSLVIQQWLSYQLLTSLKAQVMTAVDTVLNVRGAAIPFAVRDLQEKYPVDMVTKELKTRFEAETDSRRKLNLAWALAAFGTVHVEFLVSQTESVTGDDTENHCAALATDRKNSLKALRSEAFNCDHEKNWRVKSEMAILSLYLGNPDLAAEMCQFETRLDPVQRTVFIDEFPKWHWQVAELAKSLRSCTDSGLRSAILLAAGSIPDERLSSEEKQAWQAVAEEWYASQPDGSTHSTSEWLLRQWKLPVPEIVAGTATSLDKDWYVNSQRQTFVRMQPGIFRQLAESNAEKQDLDVKIWDSFWLMDREVSVDQFQRFMDDTTYKAGKPEEWKGVNEQYSPTPDHPANSVSWYDAVLYCNWLSSKESLPPAYEQTGTWAKAFTGEYAVWRMIDGSIGYRLPSQREWEYACRAGTTTDFACGSDEDLLWGYAQCRTSKLVQCGVKFPNAWGLCDMHGNVQEFNNDLLSQSFSPCALCGGAFNSIPSSTRSANRIYTVPDNRYHTNGFRVARTFEPAPFATVLPAEGESRSQIPETAPQAPAQPEPLKPRQLYKFASGGIVTSAQHSSDNPKVFLGGIDRVGRLFDLNAKKSIRIFRGHENSVSSVAISPDETTFLTGSEDKTARFWNTSTGQQDRQFSADGIFSCVRFSADGEYAYATNWDKKVRIWKRPFSELPREFTYDNPILALALPADGQQLVLGTFWGDVLLCDAKTGEINKRFEGHRERVNSVAICDSGARILSASHDRIIRLWDVASGQTLRTFRGHTEAVSEIEVLADGQRLISCGLDRTLRLWDLKSGCELARGSTESTLQGLSVAPDGKSCLTAGPQGLLMEWELASSSSDATSMSADPNRAHARILHDDGDPPATQEDTTSSITVKLLSPEEGAELPNGSPTDITEREWPFDWEDVPMAAKYHLVVMGSAQKIAMIDRDDIVESEWTYKSEGFTLNKNRRNWTWKVRAFVNGKWTEWSAVRNFDVEEAN